MFVRAQFIGRPWLVEFQGEVPPHPRVLRLRGSKFMCLRNSVYKILKEMKTSLEFWNIFDVISGCTKLRL